MFMEYNLFTNTGMTGVIHYSTMIHYKLQFILRTYIYIIHILL